MFKSENVGKSKPRKKQTKKKQTEVSTEESPVGQYVHPNEKRKNNPPVGMVDPNNDPDQPSKRYSFDPRLDPQLQWSGKTENSEFDVDTVSLHEHEKIDPLTIIEKTMKEHKQVQQSLFHFFKMPENYPSLKDAIEFYEHDQNWSNRLIAGDSLLVMNSLLQKESMGGKVQMIYIDPPYGVKYGSNFQPFVNQREVKDRKDDDLTQEPETIKAFRDTWELGIHSYLTYLHKRLLIAKKLLDKSGSCFVQISDNNLPFVRCLMNEVFGEKNFISQISFQTTPYATSMHLPVVHDYLVWYAKDKKKMKYRQLFKEKTELDSLHLYRYILSPDGKTYRSLTSDEIKRNEVPIGWKRFSLVSLVSQGASKEPTPFEFEGKEYNPPKNNHWKISVDGLNNVAKLNRLQSTANSIRFRSMIDDFPISVRHNMWTDTITGSFTDPKRFAVQTNSKVIERCILMTTDPGDLVFDPTCGSGTTSFAAEKWGRRWISCDTSRIAINITKQRMMTSFFDYYELLDDNQGLTSGFKYKKVTHITLGVLANNQSPIEEILYDQPIINHEKKRMTGPFTMESVPSPTVRSIDMLSKESNSNIPQSAILTQQEWREELLRTGIRGKGGQKIEFSKVESHPATKWLHADAETKEAKPKRVMVSFGPEYSPLESRQIANAIEESNNLVPKPEMIIFTAMQFDPEAAKTIEELNWPGVTILKAEMNKDLLTHDLKKKQSTSESFWLMGSPDVECKKQEDGKYIVTVNGFDYYNTQKDKIESGGSSKIAMWELDIDYDGRSLYPQQVFFPIDGKSGGWNKLAKTLRENIDEDLITKYQGIESIPFDAGINNRIAVKIIDDRGIESLKIIDLE